MTGASFFLLWLRRRCAHYGGVVISHCLLLRLLWLHYYFYRSITSFLNIFTCNFFLPILRLAAFVASSAILLLFSFALHRCQTSMLSTYTIISTAFFTTVVLPCAFGLFRSLIGKFLSHLRQRLLSLYFRRLELRHHVCPVRSSRRYLCFGTRCFFHLRRLLRLRLLH